METDFTPYSALIGGLLLGVAAVLMMAANGKISGISGIIAELIPIKFVRSNAITALGFIIGLILAAPLYIQIFGSTPTLSVNENPWVLAIAGAIVGIGVSLGSGCTSGHGVCGIARLSMRSILATIVFMLVAILTVTIIRHTSVGLLF